MNARLITSVLTASTDAQQPKAARFLALATVLAKCKVAEPLVPVSLDSLARAVMSVYADPRIPSSTRRFPSVIVNLASPAAQKRVAPKGRSAMLPLRCSPKKMSS